MQVNRERLLELAVQGGATIDNAERVARDWESYIGELPDPLRLDTPAPVPQHLLDEMKRIKEINWDRPQILRLVEGNTLVELSSDGEDFGRFSGYRLDSALKRASPVCNWYKSHFVYHGEIPQEPDTKKTFSIFDMRECFEESRLTHPMAGFKHGKFSDYLKWAEIPQEQREESKTTGLNFLEAVNMNINGHCIKRERWGRQWSPWAGNHDDNYANLSISDILATDWQIIEP